MIVTINGNRHEIDPSSRVADLPAIIHRADLRGLAIAVNGEVVSRSEWEDVRVEEGARVEILQAVQGG